jgi:hypothetical protein
VPAPPGKAAPRLALRRRHHLGLLRTTSFFLGLLGYFLVFLAGGGFWLEPLVPSLGADLDGASACSSAAFLHPRGYSGATPGLLRHMLMLLFSVAQHHTVSIPKGEELAFLGPYCRMRG